MGRIKPISRERVEAAIRAAEGHGAKLDYFEGSVTHLERLISSWEHMVRVANDLDDEAYVGDQLDGVCDLPALGTYHGELFVRHAGATWGEAIGGGTGQSRRSPAAGLPSCRSTSSAVGRPMGGTSSWCGSSNRCRRWPGARVEPGVAPDPGRVIGFPPLTALGVGWSVARPGR